MVDTTTRMEQEMKLAAEDLEKLTLQERMLAGRAPISREEMSYSVNVLLQSSQLDTMPNAGEAAAVLRGVKTIAGTSTKELTSGEFLIMANQCTASRFEPATYCSLPPAADAHPYNRGAADARARDELQKVFSALPEEEQEEGRRIIRKMQAVLDARKRALAEEQEKLRAARASIAAESGLQQQEPRRKKTLAELEAAQASVGTQQPVMSLYTQ